MLKKFISLSLVTACAFTLFGCSNVHDNNKDKDKDKGKVVASVQKTGINPILEKIEVSENLPVDIYLDGTYSMNGYVNMDKPTIYVDSIKGIEEILRNRWEGRKISYIRFGDENYKLPEDRFLDFAKVSFYQQKDTSLDKLIKSVNPDHMSIIVTDLFQTNNYIQSVVYALEDKLFSAKENKGFAILGLKSQFNGTIYDIGSNHPSIKYSSVDGKPETYRPFYIMVLGKEQDVQGFSSEFQRKYKKDAKIALFTKSMGTGSLLTLDKEVGGDQTPGLKNIDTKEKLILRMDLDKPEQHKRMLVESQKLFGPIPTNYTVFCNEVKKADSPKEKKGFSLTREDGKISDKSTFKELAVQDAFTGTAKLQPSDNWGAKLAFDLRTKAAAMPSEGAGKYVIPLALIPERGEYVDSKDVFNEWNFDENAVPAKDSEIGVKTQSISKFTKQIAERHYLKKKPGFYNLTFDLDVRK